LDVSLREMAEKGVQLDQKAISCSICLDLLKDPVTTTCGHIFVFMLPTRAGRYGSKVISQYFFFQKGINRKARLSQSYMSQMSHRQVY
uniref:Zinc finger RING-type eukaryotic domain-containing protein n=1 Tax=Amphilophus citrinellus TaxID=61819 RepID=A0A3Q0R901_AMPCI